MERWAGRVAVVTGASSGIGEALAKELTRLGMKVAALARRSDRLQKLADECQSFKGLINVYKCDMSDENEVVSTLKKIYGDLGPISVLINNAATMIPINLTDSSKGSPRKIYETNVIGPVTLTQHTLEIMKKHNIDDGHIININSIVGHCVFPMTGIANYSASKHAIRVLTECLKNELASLKLKTRVTSISPGHVKTEMSDRFFEGKVPVKLSKEPVPVLSCSDIVKCVVFALSVNPNVNISELTVQPVGETIAQLTEV
ncbi:farnesol dehydrogenase-like [Rhodnius prolixus]|uniref:Dehydrogenase n=1 Tax=Rhodnius prolixus TaxID=13249 RepID=T1IE29_RHOPR